MQHIFNSVVNRFLGTEANQHEQRIAKQFYLEGIRVGSQQHEQEAALLHRQQEPYNVSLTKNEIDSIVALFSETLHLMHKEDNSVSKDQEILWQMCDKDDPESARAFNALNNLRNYRRTLKQQIKRLSAIQYKLKKYR